MPPIKMISIVSHFLHNLVIPFIFCYFFAWQIVQISTMKREDILILLLVIGQRFSLSSLAITLAVISLQMSFILLRKSVSNSFDCVLSWRNVGFVRWLVSIRWSDVLGMCPFLLNCLICWHIEGTSFPQWPPYFR